MPRLAGMSCEISGTPLPTMATSQPSAWSGRYMTVRLQTSLTAMRTSRTPQGLEDGVWFGIGDCIMTASEYRSSRALSSAHIYVARCVLPAGCIVNVGVAAAQHQAMFSGEGGGDQAEYLPGHGGPSPSIDVLDAIWSDTAGHA